MLEAMRPISLLNEKKKKPKWSSAWLKNVGKLFHKKQLLLLTLILGMLSSLKKQCIARNSLKRECQTMERRKQKDDQCIYKCSIKKFCITSIPL